MKKIIKRVVLSLLALIGLLLLTLAALIPLSRVHQNLPPLVGEPIQEWAIRNVNLVRVDSGDVVPNQTLLLSAGTITAIQPDSLPVPAGVTVKNAEGRFVMHALADMHVHIFDRTDLALYLSYGITHVRNMMGFPMHLRWRGEVEQRELVGSTMVTASPTLNHGGGGGPFHQHVASPEAARDAAQAALAKGYDFLKVYDGLSAEQLAAIRAVAEDADVAVAGHPPYALSLEEVYGSGLASIEHVEEIFQGLLDYAFDEAQAREIARNLREAQIPVTVTMSAYNHLYRTVVDKDAFLDTLPVAYISPLTRFIGKKQLAGWKETSQEGYDWTVKKYAFLEQLVRILHEEGVTLLLGTDMGPNLTVAGWSMHREMQLLTDIGLSPQTILRSGTVDAAPVLASSSFAGQIEEETQANLILVQENPLNNLDILREPHAVVTQAHWYDANALAMLRDYAREEQSPWYITLGRFLDHIWQK